MGLRLIFSITFTVCAFILVFLPFSGQTMSQKQAMSQISGEISVNNAWVRYNPMSGRSSAAYVKIENLGNNSVRLVGVSAPHPAHAMLHQTITTDGISRMSHLDSIDIAAGTSFVFEPRGAHIMLMNMPTDLEMKTNLMLELSFASGKKLEVPFKLCPLTASEIC